MARDDGNSRRQFIKLGAAAGGLALAGAAWANRHHFDPGEHRGAKMQMMAVGERAASCS